MAERDIMTSPAAASTPYARYAGHSIISTTPMGIKSIPEARRSFQLPLTFNFRPKTPAPIPPTRPPIARIASMYPYSLDASDLEKSRIFITITGRPMIISADMTRFTPAQQSVSFASSGFFWPI